MTNKKLKPVVLVVDDTPNNISLLKSLLTPKYVVKAATNGPLAINIAQTQHVDLILLDVMMPEMDGYEVCRKLKSNETTANIPIIFVTAMNDAADESKGFELGAVDYITKPVVPVIVNARVAAHIDLANQRQAIERIVDERTAELQQSQNDAISMLGIAGHYNDTDTGVHIWRMAAYAEALALAVDWSVQQADLLKKAAPMHDVGKIGIPDEILKAPRRLTDEEMTIMKTHAAIGKKILSTSQTPLFKLAAEVAHYHHERWDGSGYPDNLSGADIPESARIVAVADVFDALTMVRPYKKAWSVDDAFAYLQDEAGKHFDPKLIEAFCSLKPQLIEIKDIWDSQEESGKGVNHAT